MNKENIASQVASAGGLQEVSMLDLRRELGYKRLGRYVLEEIAEALDDSDLGFFPQWKLDPTHNHEPRQDQTIWLYTRDGSAKAMLFDVMLDEDPSEGRLMRALAPLNSKDYADLSAEQKLALIQQIASSSSPEGH